MYVLGNHWWLEIFIQEWEGYTKNLYTKYLRLYTKNLRLSFDVFKRFSLTVNLSEKFTVHDIEKRFFFVVFWGFKNFS